MEILELPLDGEVRARLRAFADAAFMDAARRAECVRMVKQKWNPDHYIDTVVTERDLPIDVDQLEYLIEASVIHEVVRLADAARS